MSDPLIGRTLGKYKIVALLGQGGMAQVYQAYQANLDRHVALKLMRTSIADDPDSLARFEREAKSAAALRHPNIVQIHDFDVDAETGQPYMVIELLEGGSLADELERREASGHPFTLDDVSSILGQMGAALAYAHQRGVVHRDIKPSNMMRDASGRLILTDLGLAKVMTAPSVTASGVSVGTPDYMAPEQVMGGLVDARADLYALGVILFKLLTGYLPFQGDSATAVMLKRITDPPPDPRLFEPHLSEAVTHVVLTCLAQSPGERYQTADELVAAFETARSQAAPPVETSATQVALPLSAPRPAPPAAPVSGKTPGSRVVTLEITPPPQPSTPPTTVDFVGRETELDDYARRLATQHLAVVIGMPGVGKTALAAELARRQAQAESVFWHSFHKGEGIIALIWKLAGFLSWHNQHDLWNTLQGSTQSGSQAPPSEVLLDYVFQMVRGQGYLICLDDFHWMDDDPLLGQFIERLLPALAGGQLDVVLASQRRPSFVPEGDVAPLHGLTVADVRALLTRRGLTLAEDLLQELVAFTDGNALMVMMALDTLRRASEPARLIRRLSESEQVEQFLVREVDQGLSEEERGAMCAIAVLLGQPGTRDAISAVLDGASVRRPLNDLVSRSLINVSESDSGKAYTLNVIVQSYYYDLLSQRERQAMHRRAAEFYTNDDPDALRAALHWQRCGEHTRALELFTSNVWAIINQGQARTLRQALDAFVERQMDQAGWANVLVSRGQVYALLGETQLARASYEAAYTQARALSDAHELEARACRGLGELLQSNLPQEALDWLRRGLEAIQGKSSQEEAALRIRIGRPLVLLGRQEEALTAFQEGLKSLPPGPSRLRIAALGNLGNIYCLRGEIGQGLECYQQVLDNAQRMKDYWAMVEVWLNLGIVLSRSGRWGEALAQYHQALEQAEKLGGLFQQARALLGLGNTYVQQGEWESADTHLSRCLSMASSHNWTGLIIHAANSLAYVHLARGELEAAEARLTQVEELTQSVGVREPLPETYRHWALVRLAQNRFPEALACAEQSVGLARELKSYSDEGIGLRVLGQAQWANGQTQAAQASFEASVQVLGDREPVQSARTQVEWARRLRSTGQVEQSAALTQASQAAFRRLGAKRDLDALRDLMG